MINVIKAEYRRIPILYLCDYFGVSRSGYYSWIETENRPQFIKKSLVCKKIKSIFEASKQTYGAPRIYRELKELNILVSENTTAKYMKEMNLDARLKKKFRIQTTNSNHASPIAPRLFKVEEKDGIPSGPGQILAGDITYLYLGNSFVYLSVVMDLFNREIVGWSMSRSLETQLVLNSLDSAMRKVGPDAEIIFHSDRGSQYASEAYRNFMKNNKINPSMSRKGNCYDNAYVESWFSSLKKEWIYRHKYSTESELRSIVFEYIEVWYNRKRKHSSLDYQSPAEYKLTKIAF